MYVIALSRVFGSQHDQHCRYHRIENGHEESLPKADGLCILGTIFFVHGVEVPRFLRANVNFFVNFTKLFIDDAFLFKLCQLQRLRLLWAYLSLLLPL